MLIRTHRALYAAFDRFPSRKGAAIHIDRFARALFSEFGGGCLSVLGDHELPPHQLDDAVEIVRFRREIPNYLDRAVAYQRHVASLVRELEPSLEIAHFRDAWSGAAITLRPRHYRTIYEVNALASVELPYLYPAATKSALEKIRAMELACCHDADAIVTPSHTTAGFLADLGVAHGKITVVPNGADIPERLPRPVDAPTSYLLYFGSPQAWQGIDTLLRAFHRVRDHEDLRLVLCASHDSKAWKKYRKLAAKLEIEGRIDWHHALDEEELWRWIEHATAVIAPLTDTPRNVLQGCAPLKILEAMAAGAVVIASDVPPVREIVTDRDNGWLVHPDRPAELARAIRILLDHPDTRQQLARRARSTIEQRFSWNESLAKLRSVYRQLVPCRLKGVEDDERLSGLQVAQ